ncbi:MAG: hypothetical protein ACFE0Q_06385 [Anaerolineae bacterium]
MTSTSASSVYLFNLRHYDFVQGDTATLPTAVTRKIAIRQYIYLMFVVCAPIIIGILIAVYLLKMVIEWVLLMTLTTALVTCAVIVLRRYLRDRTLRHHGVILYGEVLRQDILPGYAYIGRHINTRIFYYFLTPDDERVVDCVDISHNIYRMPDERKYPEAGTSVAILYVNKSNYKLL